MTCHEFEWGYYCIEDGKVYIPMLTGAWRLNKVLAFVHKKTGKDKFTFTAVLNATQLKEHLHNIISERDEWFEQVGDYSHCIEIQYMPRSKDYTLADQAHGVCPYCLASADEGCKCEKQFGCNATKFCQRS